jgi:leucyl aminopeptidase (aminopeptidase T)
MGATQSAQGGGRVKIVVMDELTQAIETVLGRCLAIRDGEQVLVVCDSGRRDLGDALHAGAARMGADAVLLVMPPTVRDGAEPLPSVAAALREADVFIAPTTRSLSHTRARKAASENGARGATLPGVTTDILARLMACDFELMGARSRALAELLTASDSALVTCPRGTHLEVELTGRTGIADDGVLASPGAFGNLPCGEGFIAPTGGSGTVVVSSIASIGVVEPTPLTLDGGRLVDGHPGLLSALGAAGEDGTHFAEFAVGTNERATMTGNVIEDEKILGTIHVAFGASAGIGGTVSVPVHLDCVVTDPTVEIGGTKVLEGGEFVLAV